MIKNKNIDPNAAIEGSKLASIPAAAITDGVLTGAKVANAAAADVVGAIPVWHFVSLATTGATTTNTDVVLTHKTKILDAFVVKTSAAAANNDANTVQILSSTNAITDALSIRNKADTDLTRFTQVNDANQTIAAGGTLRVARVLANASDNNACDVYILGLRVA